MSADRPVEQPFVDNVESRMGDERVPGVGVAVVKGSGVASLHAFGVRSFEAAEPVTERTVFSGVSLGKPVFAMCVLKLADAGVLPLDDAFGTYVPVDDQLRAQGIAGITARQVLTHTSGIVWNDDGSGTLLPLHPPGHEYKYSGAAPYILQLVMEEVTGRTLMDVVSELVLVPLGMNQTSYVWRDEYSGDWATGHDADGHPYQAEHLKAPRSADAASSLRTTAADYGAFIGACLTKQHMSSDVHDALTKPSVEVHEAWGGGPPKDTWWSAGFGVSSVGSDRHIWHWGWSDGYRAFATGSLEHGDGLVVMTNGDRGLWVCKALVNDYFGAEHPAFPWLEH